MSFSNFMSSLMKRGNFISLCFTERVVMFFTATYQSSSEVLMNTYVELLDRKLKFTTK